MKKLYCTALVAAMALGMSVASFAAAPVINFGEVAAAPAKAPAQRLTINGTGNSATFKINASNLPGVITLTATPGFEVYPAMLPADAGSTDIKVTLTSTLPVTEGQIILRSGDHRAYVYLTGKGTELEQKDLSATPVYTGSDNKFVHLKGDGFTAGKDGYTIEFRAKLNKDADAIDAYAVTTDGAAFQAYVAPTEMGLYNGSSKIAFGNPLTAADGGQQKFYNNDGKAHTYRFAVTSDARIRAYRDGIEVAMLRTEDYGHLAEWATADGELTDNLLKNGNFEGEWNQRASDSLVNRVQGWIVDPIDQYNCNYFVENYEINNDLDHNNHVLRLQRYNWNDGWGAGTVSQIVNVAPNSTYSLSFLAGGGMDKKSGTNMSSVKIQEVGNDKLGTSVTITNEEGMIPYGLNYTTSADCKQIKVIVHNERFLNGGGWGSSPVAFRVDEMELTGMSRVLDQKTGFNVEGGTMEYFTYDVTGAYAPVTPVLAPAESAVVLRGTNDSKKIKVNIANLVSSTGVSVSATTGFEVYPAMLAPDADGEITVTLLSTLPETTGKVILRSGDLRTYIDLTGYANDLEEKALAEGAAYAGGKDRKFSHAASDGWNAGKDGYTIEVRAKINKDDAEFNPFAVTTEGAAFKAYIAPEAMGFYNGKDQISLSNPATAETGGKQKFYNNDGQAHTYRFAVTSDGRINVFRDGLAVGTVRAGDYGNQPEWIVADGELSDNLLKNGDFEGEWNARTSDKEVYALDGWVPNPIDQYNCQYRVINKEIDNEYDHNNHVMKLQRYNWNDGWGAGTVSQIVNVAPNSTYSLSFLACGGMDKKSGTNMSSVKIQEAQDSRLGTSVTITNEETLQPYGLNYTTSADCKQIKVILYNERFLNGGGWGSSPQATLIDNMELVGMSRTLDQLVGFDNGNAIDVEYFAYDPTGAYAPLSTVWGEDFAGIDEVAAANAAYARTTANGVAFYNVEEGASLVIYDTLGAVVATVADYTAGAEVALSAHGMYVAVLSGTSTSAHKFVY